MTSNSNKKLETILIVDDTPDNLSVLSDLLSECGYRILVAIDGQSALEQIDHLQPDLILLDVIMPGIDGFETCRKLKKNPQTKHIPIIFMTGLSELDKLLQGFDEGAVDYIVKPIRPAEVQARIEVQLSQKRNAQRIEQTLNHMKFAALTFKQSGQITWLSTAADLILSACFPLDKTTSYSGMELPANIHKQLLASTKENEVLFSNEQFKTNYHGKVIPCSLIDEKMLLIQENSEQWDLASLNHAFSLTTREAEILMWVSRGKTNKEVGLILETSPRTVNKHFEHIFEKLGVPTRAAAVATVLRK